MTTSPETPYGVVGVRVYYMIYNQEVLLIVIYVGIEQTQEARK